MTIGTISQTDSKEVNTKFGSKATYSYNIDGTWYRNGFKQAPVSQGDEVEFEFKETQYGKELINIRKIGTGSVPANDEPSAAPQRSGANPLYAEFKVDMPKDRAIIRQNALTHATNVVMSDGTLVDATTDMVAAEVIRIARLFESYSTGELDVATADNLM